MRADVEEKVTGVDMSDAAVSYEIGFLNELQLRIGSQVYYFHYRTQEECLTDYHDLKNYIKTHQ